MTLQELKVFFLQAKAQNDPVYFVRHSRLCKSCQQKMDKESSPLTDSPKKQVEKPAPKT